MVAFMAEYLQFLAALEGFVIGTAHTVAYDDVLTNIQ